MTADDDDSGIKLARRYRREAIAALVCVIRNDAAPNTARAIAAEKLLNISDGKPVSAKPVVTDIDIDQLSDDDCEILHEKLLERMVKTGWMPQLFKDELEDEELEKQPPPSFPTPLSLRTRLRPRLTDDDDPSPRRIRRRPRLVDDDDATGNGNVTQLEPTSPPPKPIPVPGPNEILIHCEHNLNVPWHGHMYQFRRGYCIAPASMANHNIVKRLIVHEADHAA